MKKIIIVSIGLISWMCFSEIPSTEDLTKQSSLVVIGTAFDKQTIQVKGPRGLEVSTIVRFYDLDVLKGQHQKNILVLKLPGGVLPNGTSQVVVDAPSIQMGERYVLFTKGGRVLTNLRYGGLHIQQDIYGNSMIQNHQQQESSYLSEVINEVRWTQ